MKKRLRRGGLVLLAVACAGAAGCGRVQSGSPQMGKTPEVKVSAPVTRDVTDYDNFPGRTEASRAVDVRAQVTGYLDKINFEDGAVVQKGDVLFEIDPRIYKAQLARAEANVVQSEAHRRRLESDYQRAVALLPTKAMSQEDFDKVAGDRQEAEAAIGVARAERDVAKQNLDFCKVTASIGGRISRRLLDPGNLVKANDTPMTTIVALNPMYVYFDVDERTVLRLTEEGKINRATRTANMPVLMGLASEEPNYPHRGTVDFVDNQVDPGTGTLRLRGVFDNYGWFGTAPLFSPGLFVRVRLPLGTPHPAKLVAEHAVGRDQGQKFLYVIKDEESVLDDNGDVVKHRGVVEYRRVEVGRLHDGLREITRGLKSEDKVIVSGLQRVRDGDKVLFDDKTDAASRKP
jgi:RND family efflux transporter MFP subunit